MTSPLFSIITITWNAEATIGVTLDSVQSQSCKSYEYIVIDGLSSDATLSLINDRKGLVAKLVSERDAGLYDAMNKGIDRATGEYLIFLNAGDTFYSAETLADIAQQIGDNRPDIIYGETALVDSNRQFLAMRRLQTPEVLDWHSFKHGMLVCHQAFIAKRTIVPHYNCDYRLSSDFDWCIRCMQRSKERYNTHLTLINYLNEGVTTRNMKQSLKERYHIMAHYYGQLPTAVRHLFFAVRYFWARLIRREG